MKALPFMVSSQKRWWLLLFSILGNWPITFFLFSPYVYLLHLLFDAFLDHVWLTFWHKKIAFDVIQPKISWFLIFSIFASKGAQRDQKLARAILTLQECYLIDGYVIGKERTLFWKTVVEMSIIKNIFAQVLWCHYPWLWRKKSLRPKGKIACQNKALLALC